MSFPLSEYTKIDVGLPRPLTGFKGAASRQDGNGGKGREGLGERGEGRGKVDGEGRGNGGS